MQESYLVAYICLNYLLIIVINAYLILIIFWFWKTLFYYETNWIIYFSLQPMYETFF